MVQPSKRFDLWRRLYTRFLIEPVPVQEGEEPSVSTSIIAVTDADALLEAHGAVFFDTASFDADVQVTGLTVPDGERWKVQALNAIQASGNRTINQMRLRDVSANINYVLDTFTAAVDHFILLGTPFTLEEGDQINIVSSGGSTASTYQVSCWRATEDAF